MKKMLAVALGVLLAVAIAPLGASADTIDDTGTGVIKLGGGGIIRLWSGPKPPPPPPADPTPAPIVLDDPPVSGVIVLAQAPQPSSVPEPSLALLLGLGLVGLAGLRRMVK